MKRESSLLLDKAFDSLLLTVNHFNSVHDRGRVCAVLILLDHSLEMLLKASIVELGGSIRDKDCSNRTIGFDTCVRRGLSDGSIKFLSENQAIGLQTINGQRDAAQHYLLSVEENQLYIYAQMGLTLFRDILQSAFDMDLRSRVPDRSLPISTVALTDIETLFESEAAEIARLLRPGSRRRATAYARLRPIVILDQAVQGEKGQPDDRELAKRAKMLREGMLWTEIFPGVASIQFDIEGHGPSISLRIVKNEGIPVHIVPENTPGASVVALRKVNELDYYSLSHTQLAKHVSLTPPKLTAVLRHLKIETNVECCKDIPIGKSVFRRFSPKAIIAVQAVLRDQSLDDIWQEYKPQKRSLYVH